ncbi:MAG: hypothetical protein RL329_3424 [Bacteroidota bacterium]|jgi:tRNA isopentenyl-2-thiomethyl-A-37 hydroxylase MiaE
MVKLEFQIGLEDLVLGLAQLEASELKQVFEQLSARIVAPPPVPRLHQEIVLLKRIKAMIPATVVRRLKVLQNKRQQQTITPKELSEMLLITDWIEIKSAERIPLLGELAQLRQVSIRVLAQQLNLKNFHG